MSRAVGIDFGTTNSVMAVLEGAEPVIIPNSRGDRLTPSIVSFQKDGQVQVGVSAKNQAVINHERTVLSVKRKFGEDFTLDVDGKMCSAPELAAYILRRMKEDAEEYLGEPLDTAIITVPAYFNDGQRQDVKRAGELAGLKVMRLINEPTAAALAFGLPRNQEGLIVVFDLGGGTFDVSVLDISGSVYEVVATCGNNRLGGDDFDACLVEHMCADFFGRYGIDLREDRMAMQKVRDTAELVKKELSEAPAAAVNIPFISADQSGPKHLEMEITRETFEGIIQPYLDEMEALVVSALNDAAIEADRIDAVVLVGGSTRIPAVQRMLEKSFGERVLRSVNPDEAVAAGAAIQAGIMTGAVHGLVLVDVTPLTLGIETDNDVFVPIIERNSCIPTAKSRIFTTIADAQTSVEVHILQGERPQASRNHSLGKFLLSGIRPAERGEPRIEVTFDIDVNGIVHVSARDQATGKSQRIEITPTLSNREEEVQRVLQEAAMHEKDDKLFVERGALVKQAQVLLSRLKDKLRRTDPGETGAQPEIAEVVAYIEAALREEDIEQVRNAVNTMSAYLEEAAELSQL